MNTIRIISSAAELSINPVTVIPRSYTTVGRSLSEGSLLLSKRSSSSKTEPPVKVIVDVDAGVDDAMALMLLLAADNQKIIKILGITCSHGNTSVKNVCVNVLRLLGTMNRFDIPVYEGVEAPLIPRDTKCDDEFEHFHGLDGFGDLAFSYTPSVKLIQSENAVSALNMITSDPTHAGKVTLICLAPLTNIALAMKTYSQFSKNLKGIYIMGGNSTGMGNITAAGEFNFYSDPEAAHIVLTSASCPIHLLPWETCLECEISLKKVWEKSQFTTWLPCDALLAASVLEPNIVIKSRHCHASVELHGTHTRGQVVLDHLKVKGPNVHLIEKVEDAILKRMFLWAAGHPNSGYLD
ncbi:hypothetical protein C0J52_05686 [Blattella germanica]|nr:hypothetical protein C0J52_05686 [Blattella germanica]